jgi:hypothetical protein
LTRIEHDFSRQQRGLSTPTLNEKNRVFLKVRDLVTPLATKESAILANPKWTDDQRAEKRADLKKEATGLLTFLKEEQEAAAAKGARLNATIRTVEPKYTDGLIRQLRGMELRQVFRAMDPTKQALTFLQAADANNTEFLDAVLQAPDVLLPPDLIERGLAVRAARIMPDIVELAEQQTLLEEHVNSLTEHVTMWMNDLARPAETLLEQSGASV